METVTEMTRAKRRQRLRRPRPPPPLPPFSLPSAGAALAPHRRRRRRRPRATEGDAVLVPPPSTSSSPPPPPSPHRRRHGLFCVISAASSPSIRDFPGPPRRRHLTTVQDLVQVRSKIQCLLASRPPRASRARVSSWPGHQASLQPARCPGLQARGSRPRGLTAASLLPTPVRPLPPSAAKSQSSSCKDPSPKPQDTAVMDIERCRIWWPRQELQLKHKPFSPRLVLFGWFFSSAGSIDIVISAVVPQDHIMRSFATLDTLQTIVLSSNKRMPVSLQESAAFAVLGDCSRHPRKELEEYCLNKLEQLPLDANFVQKEHFGTRRNNAMIGSIRNGDQGPSYDHRRWGCDCCVLDGFLDACRKSAVKEGSWVHLCWKFGKNFKSNMNQVPVLHHLYLDGQQIENNRCHVILYEVPTIGRNHFSLGLDSPRKLNVSFKKPNWINDLQKQPTFLDLDSIVLALNCSNAARLLVTQDCSATSSGAYFIFASVYDVFVQVTWHCMGIFFASASTILYIMILMFRKCLSHMPQYLMLNKVFRHSWNNIHLRSCQILYWPIVLQDASLSSTVNVEYAHKAAIRKHALWSSIIVDLLMGFVLGAAFLLNTEIICIWTIALVHHMTEAILRSGCVWLMGVPAGFKLNTELAELLGMISLNAVQIYSTLWFFMGGYLRHIIQGIAVSGIILGLTAPVSFFIDIIQLATLHVTMLHWLISSLYSRQIQTVASLWRLFRGRKWNPLRQRLDSYDYTVEQHVVGSLLFTPVLLLIPTTSVFYVFFSILTTTVIWVCVMLEIVIAVIQSTPYAELTLWLVRRHRFPAGLFFLHVPSSGHTSEDGDLSAHPIGCCNERRKEESLVSELRCSYATLAQVTRSNYERVFNRTGYSFCKQLAYGILSGERVPSSLHLQPSPSFPWIKIGITEYWMHCYVCVLQCAPKRGP